MHINPIILEEQPFLKQMSPARLEALAEDSVPVEFKADERIYLYENGPASHFYLILDGQVKVKSAESPEPAEPVQILGTGDILGGPWLFGQKHGHLEARTATPTKAIFFFGKSFRELCAESRDFGYELVTVFLQSATEASRMYP